MSSRCSYLGVTQPNDFHTDDKYIACGQPVCRYSMSKREICLAKYAEQDYLCILYFILLLQVVYEKMWCAGIFNYSQVILQSVKSNYALYINNIKLT